MNSYFQMLLRSLYNKSLHKDLLDDKKEITAEEIVDICRKFMDKVAMKMIINEFEDEKIIKALLNLGRVERIIVAFNVIEDMELSELAFILDSNLNSVYAQKSTALKKLKVALESVD